MRYRTAAIAVALVVLLVGGSGVKAMMITPDYWVGTEKITVTDMTSEGVSVYTASPHVCFKPDNNTGSPYCYVQNAMGIINPSNDRLTPYGSEEELPYRSNKSGELLPYNGSELLREDHEGSSSTLHVCSLNNLGCTVEKIDDGPTGHPYYQIQWNDDKTIHYENTDEVVRVLNGSVNFSETYNSPVAFDTNNNLLFIDTNTAQARIIGYEQLQHTDEGSAFMPNVSVSGSNVIVSSTGSEAPYIHVYSVWNCNYGTRVSAAQKYPCRMWDMWNGTILGQRTQFSLKATAPVDAQPYSAYFDKSDQISVVEALSPEDVNPIRYTINSYGTSAGPWATPPEVVGDDSTGTAETPINLLALGDSYISGEGAYSYLTGTDTSNNKCHQSSVSYPYLLGAKYAATYHSVACSGAVTDDIINGAVDYSGQIRSNEVQGDYNQDELRQIIANHSAGYINQLKFITHDKPNVVLLSIGGNDAFFANVVTTCVLSPVGEPCFDSQSERIGLMNMVHGLHSKLRETYRSIKEQSPGVRLYVMGYPQVVSTTGTCASYVHLDGDERLFAKYFIDEINATVQNAAEAEGVYYVDISRAFQGHRLCDSTDDAVNGLTRGDDTALTLGSYTFGIGNESYHPTVKGHDLIADAIADQTYNLTAASNDPTNAGELPLTRNKLITTAQPDNNSIVTSLFGNITNPLAVPGKLMQVDFDTTKLGITPGTAFRLVFHSQEVEVASGRVASDGTIQATFLPPHVSYGGHTLHMYITDKDGKNLDIIQNVFVVANELDYDGDGLGNATDPLPFINDTGKIIGGLFETETTQGENQAQSYAANPEPQKTPISAVVALDTMFSSGVPTFDVLPNDIITSDQVSGVNTKVLGDVVQSDVPHSNTKESTVKQGVKGYHIALVIVGMLAASSIVCLFVVKHKRNGS